MTARSIHPTAALAAGLALQGVEVAADRAVITVPSTCTKARCPACGEPAHPTHGRYARTSLDLPTGGRSVRLRVAARRYRCDMATCALRIFAERLCSFATCERRSARLDALAHHLALAKGGRPSARLRALKSWRARGAPRCGRGCEARASEARSGW